MKGLRAVFYARVSTQEEAQLKALPKQVEECIDCIKSKGWALVDQYVDEGKSGTKIKGRDEYQRLLDDLEGNKFDIIVIKSQDRLQRNTKDWYIFVDKLVTNGKRLYMYLENTFYTTDNALITGIKAILAEEYSRDLSKKLNNANKRRIERAKTGEKFSAMGTNMLYGFYIKDGEYVVDREQAEIVKLVYKLYLELDSVSKVRDTLNRQGYRNQKGKPFCADSITRMLKNEHYKGMYVLNRSHRDFDTKKIIRKPVEEWVCVENAHEAIISPEIWQRVNDRIAQKTQKYQSKDGTVKKVGRKVGSDILSGKMFCSCCGAVMWRHASGGYYNWFCSSNYSRGIGCNAPVSITTVRVRKVYKSILQGLKGINIEISKSFIKNSFKRDLLSIRDSLTMDIDNTATEKEIEKLEKKKKKLTEAYLEEIISKEDYKEKYEELEHKIEKLQRLLVPAEVNPDVQDIDYTLAHFDEEFEAWIKSDPEHFEDKQIDFLIGHTKKITVLENKDLGVELDLLAGWMIVAGNNMVGYVEKEEKADDNNAGKQFVQYVLERMPKYYG